MGTEWKMSSVRLTQFSIDTDLTCVTNWLRCPWPASEQVSVRQRVGQGRRKNMRTDVMIRQIVLV